MQSIRNWPEPRAAEPLDFEKIRAGYDRAIYPKKPFNPAAETFCPHQLGLTRDDILACVKAYRSNGDWQEILNKRKGLNDALLWRWVRP